MPADRIVSANASLVLLIINPLSTTRQIRRARFTIHIIVLLATLLAISAQCFGDNLLVYQIADRLRGRIEAAGIPPAFEVGNEIIYASKALPMFYVRRLYAPAWSNFAGPIPQAESLLTVLERADREGLRPEDYHLNKIRVLLSGIRSARLRRDSIGVGRLADLDFLLTDAFLVYGTHLLMGRVDPITIDAEWHASLRDVDMTRVLDQALADGQIGAHLYGLLPNQKGYFRLREALAVYRRIAAAGGWPIVPSGPKMDTSSRGERVVLLRNRLLLEGYDAGDAMDTIGVYDDRLLNAVTEFQQRNGLDADGKVGPKTLAAINIPARDRINQIIINLERWRWLPRDLGRRHILINIANFELGVVENDSVALAMHVIVGKTYRRTPVFSGTMTYLVFSPYWNIPRNIAVSDILPEIKKNPEYLASQNMRIFRGWRIDMQEIDPATIAWDTLTADNFHYRIRQEPGPKNALGGVKFMFPNEFNVYLHDTPLRDLFARSARGFSSGCIRIQKPLELAEYVLRDNQTWKNDQILAAMTSGREKIVKLPHPIPVHLLYWTAGVGSDGSVWFRDDIYNRDRALYDALVKRPPESP